MEDATIKALIDADGKYPFIGKIHEHRIVAEKALGRSLKGTERVHHVDYNRSNNTPSNLIICPDQKYHLLLHARQRILELGGHPDTHSYCSYHKCLHDREEFSTNPRRWNGLHDSCRAGTNEYRKLKGLNRSKFDWRKRLSQQYRRLKSGYTKREISWIGPWEDSP